MSRIDNTHISSLAYDLGFRYEQTYRGCSQCTVAAVLDAFNAPNDMLFRSASGLASGGGLSCLGSCGGVTGGILLISTAFGRRRDHFGDDAENKYCSFRLARELQQHFIDTYGSVICRDIHRHLFGRTYDLLDSREKEAFETDGAHKDRCTTVVALAARWTAELIAEEAHQRGIDDIPSLLSSR